METLSDGEHDENCDTSNLQPEPGIEGGKNCDFLNIRPVMIKISKSEKILADLHAKIDETFDTYIESYTTMTCDHDDDEEYVPTSDTESFESCDTSVTKLSSKINDHYGNDDLCEYEKFWIFQ